MLLVDSITSEEVNTSSVVSTSLVLSTVVLMMLIVESFTIYEEKMLYFTEWLKQLFAETQGKDNKGILPISVLNTRDLHSLGQYYQEGKRIIFETVINIVKERKNIKTNYGKSLNDINNIACDAVAKAHYNGGVYSNIIELDELNEETIGYLIYFFELACSVSGKILGINPFDQPGVEKYKTNMFKLLGKPGYENKKNKE